MEMIRHADAGVHKHLVAMVGLLFWDPLPCLLRHFAQRRQLHLWVLGIAAQTAQQRLSSTYH